MKGWHLKEEGKRLKKYYYIEDYPSVLDFIGQVVTIDSNEFKQCPSYRKNFLIADVTGGEILELELFSASIKGLALPDFQLALRINNIPASKFYLIELTDLENYKKEVGKIRMARESAKIQKMLEED